MKSGLVPRARLTLGARRDAAERRAMSTACEGHAKAWPQQVTSVKLPRGAGLCCCPPSTGLCHLYTGCSRWPLRAYNKTRRRAKSKHKNKTQKREEEWGVLGEGSSREPRARSTSRLTMHHDSSANTATQDKSCDSQRGYMGCRAMTTGGAYLTEARPGTSIGSHDPHRFRAAGELRAKS